MKASIFNQDWTVMKRSGSVGLTAGSSAEHIDLPYDAMIHEKRRADAIGSFRTGYFPNGVWEFKKSFFVPEEAAAQKLVFRFDGVYGHSSVYINGDYSGFPPMYFTADQGEVLFDDSALLVPMIREQGVEVAFDVYEDTFHSFPTIGKVCPESAEAMKRTCSFIARHLG